MFGRVQSTSLPCAAYGLEHASAIDVRMLRRPTCLKLVSKTMGVRMYWAHATPVLRQCPETFAPTCS